MSESPQPPPSAPPPNPRRTSHLPTNPSRLRKTTASSPDGQLYTLKSQEDAGRNGGEISSPPLQQARAASPVVAESERLMPDEEEEVQGTIIEPSSKDTDERTGLLEHYHNNRVCGLRNCDHGTFSPRAPSIASTNFDGQNDSNRGFMARFRGLTRHDTDGSIAHSILGNRLGDAVTGKKKQGTIDLFAKSQGLKNSRYVYLSYYFPFVRWITQYKWEWFGGDLAAAVTMASFYIPMSLSYASNLGHIPPVNGLYAFVFNPLIYALLGTCPQMVVGPEAAGSLLVGSVVTTCIDRGDSKDGSGALNAQIAGVVTGIAGAIIFVAGLCRLGFLDSILSRPFLRGFISAIGFVILVDQAIPELGLSSEVLRHEGVQHGSTAVKMVFIVKNIAKSHKLTAAVSLSAFAIAMIFRELKKRMQTRYPRIAYFPDRFIVVAGSATLAYWLSWDKQGLELLGRVKSGGNGIGIPFNWPFQFKHVKHIDTALSTSFLIALLGFFESSVAAKSLGEGTSSLRGVNISANREMIALGAANIIGGCFQSLPAFGGYGRSKVNKSTGGTTPMSSILLSLISLLSVLFLLPYFYYLPKGVLSSMVSVVAYSLIEECPHDILFFIKVRGWTELTLMAIIFLSTVFYSFAVGIALGIGLSLLSIVRHSTKPRIQILGRVPGRPNEFENAEAFADAIEYIEGCLIVKIPEPLTFANTGALKTRLNRLEKYGTNQTHPSQRRTRNQEHNKNLIFDVHGVTGIDGSGTQVLTEIVESYVQRGVKVIFCRLPQKRNKVYEAFERSGIIELCGGRGHFVSNIEEALKLSEQEDVQEYFADQSTAVVSGL